MLKFAVEMTNAAPALTVLASQRLVTIEQGQTSDALQMYYDVSVIPEQARLGLSDRACAASFAYYLQDLRGSLEPFAKLARQELHVAPVSLGRQTVPSAARPARRRAAPDAAARACHRIGALFAVSDPAQAIGTRSSRG